MADVKQITFSHREVVEALIAKEGITEGIWGLYVEFGLQATNISTTPDESDLTPAAILPLLRMGLQRMPKENVLAVDAKNLASTPSTSQRRSGKAK